MKIVKPTKFMLKLSSCGTNSFRASYKRFEDDSALKLLRDTVDVASKDMVSKASLQLQFDLACAILITLKGWKQEDLMKKLAYTDEEYLKLIQKWTIEGK